jgi:hypothetical protein
LIYGGPYKEMPCRSVNLCQGIWRLMFDDSDEALLLSVGLLLTDVTTLAARDAMRQSDEGVARWSATCARSRFP